MGESRESVVEVERLQAFIKSHVLAVRGEEDANGWHHVPGRGCKHCQANVDLLRLKAVAEAAQNLRDGFPFLDGTPHDDFGGAWIPFVEALAALTTEQKPTDKQQ